MARKNSSDLVMASEIGKCLVSTLSLYGAGLSLRSVKRLSA